jgi:hypothetical protein
VKKRIKVSDLRKLIRESLKTKKNVLREISEYEKEKEDSLDIQVDRFLTQYESEASRSKNEGLDFRSLTRKFLLEAEDEDKKDEEADEEPEKESPAEIEAKKISAEEIDVDSFTSSVVRLIENYNNLLEIDTTIAKRAKNFLLKNYEVEAARQFEETLQNTYDMSLGEKSGILAPAQSRAGGSDEGGGPVGDGGGDLGV